MGVELLLWLIADAIPKLWCTASALAEKYNNTSLSELSLQLKIFADRVRKLGDGVDQEEHKIHACLIEIETASTWPKRREPQKFRTLQAIAAPDERTRKRGFFWRFLRKPDLHAGVQNSLRKYVESDPGLDRLLEVMKELPSLADNETAHNIPLALDSIHAGQLGYLPERLQRANTELHQVLSEHISHCSCRARQHSTSSLRLCLKPNDAQDKETIRFEVLFQTFPTSSELSHQNNAKDWQETIVLMSWKDANTPRVTFSDSAQSAFSNPSTVIELGRFCKHLSQNQGSTRYFRIDNSVLMKLDDEEPRASKFEPTGNSSLSNVLRSHRMSRKAKCILAFLLARSVWQYYDSDWMKSPWTNENILLLNEKPNTSKGTNNPYCISRPYLSISFSNQALNIPEYCGAKFALHRYPKVLALGVLLLEIAKGDTLKLQSGKMSFDEEGIEELFTSSWTSLKNAGDMLVGDDAYPSFVEAVKSCLYNDPFAEGPGPSEQSKADGSLEQRRAILYQKVVWPLWKLLEATGWSKCLDEIIQQQLPQPADISSMLNCTKLASPTSARLPNGEIATREPERLSQEVTETDFLAQMTTSPSSPEEWLKKFQKVSNYMKSKGKGEPPVRIAVLDTGCDLNASVFKVPGMKKQIIDHWEDKAGDEKTPIDQDPGKHGTRIVSVLLRIAPNAEIFVARVAPDKKGLEGSHQHIADAICHAAEKWRVDIISMSFGFGTAQDSITTAINKVESTKDQSIIFLAAAGNDGANSSELFPAWLGPVIPIRGTDCFGHFIPSFNPDQRRFNERLSVYGTLGEHVPCDAWPEGDASKTMSGCSIATPIAAAIVAVIMNCAAGSFDDSTQKLIRTRYAILEVFSRISGKGQNGLHYLAPWKLFSTSSEEYPRSILDVVIGDLPM